MNDQLDRLRERWSALDNKLKGLIAVGVPVLLYAILLRTPGIESWLHEKMPAHVPVLGLVFGAITALSAIGLILIYRANRFINFAYGALGSMIGVNAMGLHLGRGVNYFVCLVGGVVVAILLGAATDVLVIRRFQNSTRLVLTVASIGLAQIFGVLELVISQKLDFIGLQGAFPSPIDVKVDIAGRLFDGSHVMVLLLVPGVIGGLTWFLLRTDAGVAVRASAENVDRALLLGIPVRRLSTIVWAIAGGMTALTFILKAPFTGFVPGIANGPVLLLPALAAAVVARMESLPTAVGAGIGLGIMESVVRWNSSGTPSFLDVAYLIVIVAALLLQRAKISRAVESASASWSAVAVVKQTPEELRRLPEVRWVKAGGLTVLTVLMLVVPYYWAPTSQLLATYAMVWAMGAVSLVVLTGWSGNISLGQFGIMGAGGVLTANLIHRYDADLFLILIAAGAAGALCAVVVGLPALRIKGLFLAVTTLSFGVALDSYFINTNNFPDYVISRITRPMVWERFPLDNQYYLYVLSLVFVALSVLATWGVRKARSGRVLLGTRDNQRAADAASVPTTAIKMSGFILSGVIAGVAGGIYVIALKQMAVGTFPATSSIDLFAVSVIGGLGSMAGAITSVLLFRWTEVIHGEIPLVGVEFAQFRPLLTGAALLVVLYVFPGGIGQIIYSVRDRYLKWVANRRGILVPSLVADKRVTEEEDHAPQEVDLLRGALGGATPAGAGR